MGTATKGVDRGTDPRSTATTGTVITVTAAAVAASLPSCGGGEAWPAAAVLADEEAAPVAEAKVPASSLSAAKAEAEAAAAAEAEAEAGAEPSDDIGTLQTSGRDLADGFAKNFLILI